MKSPLWEGNPAAGAGEYYSGGGYHGARDIGLADHSPLYSIPGKIVASEWKHHPGGAPNYVILGVMVDDPETGKQKKASISFVHLAPLNDSPKHQAIKRRIKAGNFVDKGELIGFTGMTGNTRGPHLHIGCQWGWGTSVFAHQNGDGTIYPPERVWNNFSDYVPGKTNSNPAEDGNEETEEPLRFEGSFERVLEALNVDTLRQAEFNPPLPTGFSNGNSSGRSGYSREFMYYNFSQNKRGWIVRDPLHMGLNSDTPSDDVPSEVPEGGKNTFTINSSNAHYVETNMAKRKEEDKNDGKKKKKKKKQNDPDNGGSATSEETAGAWLGFTRKFGFRFLYNPTTYSENYQSVEGVDPLRFSETLASGFSAIVGASGGNLNFELLLYRRFDVEFLRSLRAKGNSFTEVANIVNERNYYPEKMTAEHVKRLMQEGTMYDLEYLFRVCNGDPQNTWRGESSDWGMLIPTLVVVSMGDGKYSRRIRGLLGSIDFTHEFFSTGMVPVATRVSIGFSRIPDSYYTASGEAPAPDGDTDTGDDD